MSVGPPFFFERGKNDKMNQKLKGEGGGESRGRGEEGEGEREGERRGGKEKKSEDASLGCLRHAFFERGDNCASLL